ncbi:hypothetical protein Q5692_40110, partial [Microcoleus sp. C2C3]|uniref:hypothetical protein n=1 Tax=Microcoleus sp. C2C3 TaxID=3055324 RepID=UPI002FD5D868
ESGITGVRTADVDVVTSEEFAELKADVELPPFRWLIIEGTEGSDDFFMVGRVKLAVSEAALSVLKRHGLRFAELTPLSSVHSC